MVTTHSVLVQTSLNGGRNGIEFVSWQLLESSFLLTTLELRNVRVSNENFIFEGNYSPQQIYNADETSLNFRALPTKSLASEQETRALGFKMSKERVTLMACSNAAGNHRLPLMLIGKSAKPINMGF